MASTKKARSAQYENQSEVELRTTLERLNGEVRKLLVGRTPSGGDALERKTEEINEIGQALRKVRRREAK